MNSANNTPATSFTRASVAGRFTASIEGPTEALFVVVAQRSLAVGAREALTKAAAALNYPDPPTFLFVDSPNLGKADLFELLEGLDPLCLVVAGKLAYSVVESSYNCTLPNQGTIRLFGRSAICIANIDSLLQNEEGRQQLWHLLKSSGKLLVD